MGRAKRRKRDRFTDLLGTRRGVPASLARADDPRDVVPDTVSEWVDRYGPQGDAVFRCIERAKTLNAGEKGRMVAAFNDVNSYLHDAAEQVALSTPLDAERETAWAAIEGNIGEARIEIVVGWAAEALVSKHLIPTEDYDTLVEPWRQALGEEPGCELPPSP